MLEVEIYGLFLQQKILLNINLMADPERFKRQSSETTGVSSVVKCKRLWTSEWLQKKKETATGHQ